MELFIIQAIGRLIGKILGALITAILVMTILILAGIASWRLAKLILLLIGC